MSLHPVSVFIVIPKVSSESGLMEFRVPVKEWDDGFDASQHLGITLRVENSVY